MNKLLSTMKRNTKYYFFYSLLHIAFFIASCSSTEEIDEIPVEEESITIMNVSKSLFDYGYFKKDFTYYIKNSGNTHFKWNWDNNSNTFLNLDPNSGDLVAGDSIAVKMTVDRTDLSTQNYSLNSFIRNDANQSVSLSIQLNHFVESKWLIEGTVVDAEYDRNNDMIIIVSENPNELRVFDPSDNSISTVPLNLPPSCVSVGLDGTYAVVGHNGWFSYIDLTSMTIKDNYPVTTNIYDIILAPNNWVYAISKEGQWGRARCINLLNGTETEHIGNQIRERTKVKLHPSGDFIYGANNGLIPSDIEKYDITSGVANYLYDSPYHGDFEFDGNLWISDDGKRLFTKSRRVFNSNSNQSQDMTYNGELVGEGKVMTLDFNSNTKKVFAIFSTGNSWDQVPSNEIRKYETDFLAFKGTEKLPGFLIPDENGGAEIYKSEGHFGFFNSAGTKYFVLVKVEAGSGAQNEWAIATIDVE